MDQSASQPKDNYSIDTMRQTTIRSKVDIARDLEQRTRSTFELFNRRQWDTLRTLPGISPDFVANLGDVEDGLTWEGLRRSQWHVVYERPDYRVNIVNVTVDVDPAAGHATVWMLVELVGVMDDLRGENTFVLEFRREGEEWLWWRHTNMRGSISVGATDPYRTPIE